MLSSEYVRAKAGVLFLILFVLTCAMSIGGTISLSLPTRGFCTQSPVVPSQTYRGLPPLLSAGASLGAFIRSE
jgi:hypothetical protein